MHAISTLRTLRAVETRGVVERFADDTDEAVRKEATITLARFDRLEAS